MGHIGFIFDHDAIAKADDAAGEQRNIVFMRHQHDGDAFVIELLQQRHDLDTGAAIEGTGGLICEDQLRLAYQCAGNGYALLLAAGKLRGMVIHALGKPHLREPLFGASSMFGHGNLAVEQGQGDIVQGGCACQQVEVLEHKADLPIAHMRQDITGELRDFLIRQLIATTTGLVKTTEQIHERGFAGARWPHDSNEFASGNIERDPTQGWHKGAAHRVILGQAIHMNQCCHVVNS